MRVCPPVENSMLSAAAPKEHWAPAQPGPFIDLGPKCAALPLLGQQLCEQKSLRQRWGVSLRSGWVGTVVAFSLCILQTPSLTLPTYATNLARDCPPLYSTQTPKWDIVCVVGIKNKASSLIRPPWHSGGSRQKGRISKDVGQKEESHTTTDLVRVL